MSTSTSRVISLRVAPDEWDRLTMEASAQGLTTSAYARHKLFGTLPPTPSNYGALASRVETLEHALQTHGLLDEAIQTAADVLRGKEKG